MSRTVILVGPVYVMHPFSSPTEEERRENVRLAASLSSALNQLGCATISPLQEGSGRESALTPDGWIAAGLVQLLASRAAVAPTYWRASEGCNREADLAHSAGIRIFEATAVAELGGDLWTFERDLLDWIATSRRFVWDGQSGLFEQCSSTKTLPTGMSAL